MDEQERHFIGDLLSERDDDVFAASRTAPAGGPIGRPPASAKFWPEPPPPYSPNPPQWSELKQRPAGMGYVYGQPGRGQMYVSGMESGNGGMSGLAHAPYYATPPPPQAYQSPPVAYVSPTVVPTSSPPREHQKWDSVYTPFGPVRSSASDAECTQHKDTVNAALAQKYAAGAVQHAELVSQSSMPVKSGKSYSDVASNKPTVLKRSLDSPQMIVNPRRAGDPERHSSSTDSQSENGGQHNNYTLDEYGGANVDNDVSADFLEKDLTEGQAANLSLKNVTTNTNASGEFQKITRRRGGRAEKNAAKQQQHKLGNEKFGFQVLAGQTASEQQAHPVVPKAQFVPNNEPQLREILNNDDSVAAEFRGKSPPNRKTTAYINNNLSAAAEPDSVVEPKDSKLFSGRRSGKSGRKGRRETSDPVERRRKSKKGTNGVWIWISFITWTVVGYVQLCGRWLRDLITDIGSQLWDIIGYVSRETYSAVCSGAQRSWHRTGERIRNFVFALRQRRWWSFSWWRRQNNINNSWGLEENIALPSTGDEAMQRLLSCRGQDAYSILGLRADCSDDEIKRYYKRQAVLVHPDKNTSYGADEAFKILAHAFEVIGTLEQRKSYNIENMHKTKAMQELQELMNRLREKVEEALSSMHCDCGNKHRRFATKRSTAEARYCRRCKEMHPARENDIWAESRWWGFLWYYYACMDGVVYDITEWAGCPKNLLKHMKANSHNVQYRLISAKNSSESSRSGRQPTEAEMDELLSRFLDGRRSQPPHYAAADPGLAAHGASYRPPERPTGDSRPRKAGRRRKVK